MAKKQEEIKKLTHIYTFKRPNFIPTCGCGAPAEYEVYEHREPHCRVCMLDAVDNSIAISVRTINGGFDDAS